MVSSISPRGLAAGTSFRCDRQFRAIWQHYALLRDGSQAGKNAEKRLEATRHDCICFAQAIINQWPHRSQWHRDSEIKEASPEDGFAQSLLLLHDRDTIATFLSMLAERDRMLRLDKVIPAASREFGGKAFESELKQLIFARSDRPGREDIPIRDVKWLSAFCVDDSADAGQLALAHELSALALKRFCEPFEPRRRSDARYRREKSTSEATLPLLVKALFVVGREEELSQLLEFVQSHPDEFRLDECQVPSLKVLIPWSKKRIGAVHPQLSSWLETVRRTLKSLTATAPSRPTNWGRPAEVDCQCQFCAQLNAFLSDSADQVGRISAREDYRQHLITNINRHQCDVTHTLDRTRSPYTLVLTKTNGTFDRTLKRFRTNKKLLEELPKISG